MKEHKKDYLQNRVTKFKDEQILQGIRYILDGLYLNLDDENFRETPQRILRSYYEIFAGLNANDEITAILKTSFPTEYSGMVIEGPIQCYSMCPHHFLPVIYKIYIAYIPSSGGLGLSKLPRLVELLAQSPKLQEDLTKEIVDVLTKTIKPRGVMTIVQGDHLCMQMRGIKKPGCSTKTSAFSGIFENAEVRNEFLSLVKLNGGK